ncbi:hypothetical protein FG386_000470 [Cryptosporidium ryanae]|uniref:uncharacterized protein n=1 Tax=Cryptosporidium ryanae TaxID=515981 RepID=UPI00351A5590|nr:hypothetical protein FG386_000470 [Cryptosporidium ryanae]
MGESKIEIDKIFDIKNKKIQIQTLSGPKLKKKLSLKNKSSVNKTGDDIPLSKAKPLRYASDGLPIYNIEDLNIENRL